ncbi:hypothetical protein AALO_G00281710 [Alosa alosa]|uniref:Uncharacterized protein n=2 Tax=Alosa alosa TaxID=278164 RepID=A0AAV6FPL4_9TELE|nr:hypothetical protein AALO_G00281710 [Alosa alosa]
MFRNSLKMLLTGGKSNRKNRNSSDGGSEDPGDAHRTASLDPHLYALTGQGGSVDSDCAFGDPDYAVPPPLTMVEGLQHVRMMEGVSRSLPSSPLLAHQHAGARLQPGRKIVGTAPLRKAKFVESPRIPVSALCSPTHYPAVQSLTLDTHSPGGVSSELGPPPSVDEAASTLMTRLGFLLGDKMSDGTQGPEYSMEEPDDAQGVCGTQRLSPCSTLTNSTASPPACSPCSTLPPTTAGQHTLTSPTSTLESRDSGIIATLTSYSGGGGRVAAAREAWLTGTDGSRGNLKL